MSLFCKCVLPTAYSADGGVGTLDILISGGCGFIGTNLIRGLLDRDSDVRIRVIDNLSAGSRDALASIGQFAEISDKEIADAPNRRLELVKGDIRDGNLAGAACRGMEAVVHLAANTGVIPSIMNPMADCETNVLGTINLLQGARKNRVKRFVFASSGAPLGEQKPPIHEEMAPRPVSPYGAGKLAGEAYCSAYHGSFGLGTVALRFGNVYGPYSRHKDSVVAKFIKHIFASEPLAIYGDGTQTRDFIHVEDIVQAIILCLKKEGLGGELFQIATYKEHTVNEVAEELNRLAQRHLGTTSPIVFEEERKGEIKRNFSDITKAEQRLGFEPKYDLREGLEHTFLWFLGKRNQNTALKDVYLTQTRKDAM